MTTEDKLREFLEKYAGYFPVAIAVIYTVFLGQVFWWVARPVRVVVILIVVAFSPFILREWLQSRQLKRIKSAEWQETIGGEVQKEPHFVRDLTPAEKIKLKFPSFARYFHVAPLKFSLAVLIFMIISAAVVADSWADFLSNFLIWALIGLIIISAEIKKTRAVYRDLRLPVMQVCGKLIKQQDRQGSKKRETRRKLIVRGVVFDDEFNALDYFWDKFQEGEEVMVEYSPSTKKIWGMKGVKS